jgi:hypothetical protein
VQNLHKFKKMAVVANFVTTSVGAIWHMQDIIKVTRRMVSVRFQAKKNPLSVAYHAEL